jgi:hypothetical protein
LFPDAVGAVPGYDHAAAAGVAGGGVPADLVMAARADVVGDQEAAAFVASGVVVDDLGVRRAVDVHAHVAVAPQVVAGHQHMRAGADQDGIEAGPGDAEPADPDAAGAEDADSDAARQRLRADLQRLLALGANGRSAPDKGEPLRDHHLLVIGAGANDHRATRAHRRDGGIDIAVPRGLA